MFHPLQVAARTALEGTSEFMTERNRMYKRRRDVVIEGLKACGIDLAPPKGTFYIWAPLPKGASAGGGTPKSKEWCLEVLEKIAVWMIPGSMYGKHGEGFFRIALTQSERRLAEAMERLKKFCNGY
jgi:LL-diaminopimelate aminotransferase